jgi:hypothetical protein
VVELVRRLYRGFELSGSYTFSRARGDAEDFDLELGDDETVREEERGYLGYDQRHVVKFSGTTVTPWGVRLGGTVRWESGLPYSLLERLPSMDALPPHYNRFGSPEPRIRTRYVTRQRNDQRNESHWTFDAKVQKDLVLSGDVHLSLSAEVFNIMNDDAMTIFDHTNGHQEAVRRFGRQYQMGMRLAF